MVKSDTSLDTIFTSLSNPTRRMILYQIALGKRLTFSEIANPHALSAPAISKHLALLNRAKLVNRERSGRHIYFTLSSDALESIDDFLHDYRTFYNTQMDREKNQKKEFE